MKFMNEKRYTITLQAFRSIVRNQKHYEWACSPWYKNIMRQLIALWNEDKKCYQVCALFNEYGRRKSFVHLEIDQHNITYSCSCDYISNASACFHVGLALKQMMDIQNTIQDVYVQDYDSFEEDIFYWRHHFGTHECTEKIIKNISSIRLKQWADANSNHTASLLERKKKELLPLPLMKPKVGKVKLVMEISIPQDRYLKSEGVLYQIEFKIGETRFYVVKNVADLLQRIDNESYYEYGKQLAFEHSFNNFDESSRKIIEMLNKMNSISLKFSYDYRYACIQERHLDVLYDALCELKEFGIEPLALEEKQLKYDLEFHTYDVMDHVYYGVTAKEKQMLSTDHYHYKIKGNTLIRYACENHSQLMEVLSLCESELVLREEQVKDFYELYLEPVKDYLKIKGYHLALAEREKEKFSFYCDLNDRHQMTIMTIASTSAGEHTLFDDSWKDKTFQVLKMEHLMNHLGVLDKETHEILIDENDIFEMMQDFLPQLHQYGNVYVSDRLQRFSNVKTVSFSAGVRIEAGLLHVTFSTDDLDSEEIQQMMSAYRRKKRFYLLKDGTAVDLENSTGLEEFEKMNRQLHLEDAQKSQGEYVMDASMALRFEAMQDQFENIKLERDASFKELIRQFKQEGHQPLDEKYHLILRDYQKAGYYWLKKLEAMKFNGILADDMGLGKTLQVIALLDSSRNEHRHSLVVCPSSLLYNWENEVKKFSDTLTCQVISGNAASRKQCIEQINQFDLSVITYDALKRDIDLFENQEFYYVILDEAQYIKNQRTKNAFSVKQLKCEHRLALTGTPIENSLAELWSIFDFLMPKFLFNYHYFSNAYEKPIVHKKDEEISKELKKLVEPFILRRTKNEVLKELPEKIETLYQIEFSDEEWKLYVANLAKVNKELAEQLNLDQFDRFQVLAMLTRLRQICCDPNLVFENYKETGSKMEACVELIETIASSGKKMLLFSSFTSVLDSLRDKLSEKGISSYTIQGSTPKEERARLVERFQMDDTPVFLISLRAGGTGLNLTAAEAVIHFDPWWNLSAQNQATDRAHRIGQNKTVSVYSLIMKNSIEEKIVKLQQEKKNLADVFVEDSHGSITNMSQDEILNLFEIPER